MLPVRLRLQWSRGAARPATKYFGCLKHNLGDVEGALRVTKASEKGSVIKTTHGILENHEETEDGNLDLSHLH